MTQNEMNELARLRMADQIRIALEGLKAEQAEIARDVSAMQPKLESILVQTQITNGRVTQLELWRARSAGMMAAIGAVVSFIGWLFSWLIGLWKHN